MRTVEVLIRRKSEHSRDLLRMFRGKKRAAE
jgi:hypothetical protein